jgi:hypothetical protein
MERLVNVEIRAVQALLARKGKSVPLDLMDLRAIMVIKAIKEELDPREHKVFAVPRVPVENGGLKENLDQRVAPEQTVQTVKRAELDLRERRVTLGVQVKRENLEYRVHLVLGAPRDRWEFLEKRDILEKKEALA